MQHLPLKTFVIFSLLLSSLGSTAMAAQGEDWTVDVTLSYVNSKLQVVGEIPVLKLSVPLGECVKGISRTEDMIPKPIKVTQEICVANVDGKTKISGWIFASKRITDLAFKGERGAATRGALNYGNSVDIQTDGGYIKINSGHYTIIATRTAK